jgi:hypothetical protein
LIYYLIDAVITPVAMKQLTATKERTDSLGKPQTPCPLVHPFPSFVPKPTKSPADANPMMPGSPTIISGLSKALLAFE